MVQNNYADMFKMFTENNPFSKMTSSCDMNQMACMQKKNLEAINCIGQVVVENMQHMAKRQAHLVQESAKEVMNFVKEVSSVQNPEAGMSKAVSFAKHSLESTAANTREMIEVAVKSNMEVYDLVSKKMSEMFAEAAPVSAKKKSA